MEKRITIPFKRDRNGVPVQAGSDLRILNVSLSTEVWTEIKTPADFDIKALMLKTRTGAGFKIASTSGGEYYTIPSNSQFSMSLVKGNDETIFQVRSETEEVLEVMLVR